MSITASFYLLPKSKFENFCELAKLVPQRPFFERLQSSELHWQFQDQTQSQQHYKRVWKHLDTNSKQPFEFKWGGMVINDVLMVLLRKLNINLIERMIGEESGDFSWFVFDSELKRKYLKKLRSLEFTSEELLDMHLESFKEGRKDTYKRLGKKINEKELNKFVAEEKADFPEMGSAMKDGIDIIIRYLELVSDTSVVLLRIA